MCYIMNRNIKFASSNFVLNRGFESASPHPPLRRSASALCNPNGGGGPGGECAVRVLGGALGLCLSGANAAARRLPEGGRRAAYGRVQRFRLETEQREARGASGRLESIRPAPLRSSSERIAPRLGRVLLLLPFVRYCSPRSPSPSSLWRAQRRPLTTAPPRAKSTPLQPL